MTYDAFGLPFFLFDNFRTSNRLNMLLPLTFFAAESRPSATSCRTRPGETCKRAAACAEVRRPCGARAGCLGIGTAWESGGLIVATPTGDSREAEAANKARKKQP